MFKIDFDPSYSNYKYVIYRKTYKWFGFANYWERITGFESLKEAEDAIIDLRNYPKYYA